MTCRGRVLVVEDDAVLLRARAARLRQHRLDVVTAGDGGDGLRIAKISPPADVIVVDLATLKCGIDVTRAFRTDPATAAIPVLLQSDSTSDAVHKSALAARDCANQVVDQVRRLVQPVDLDRVREFIDGTGETLQGVSHLFLADYDEKVPELADAADRRAAAAIEKLAHRVRGTASACAADRLADVLLEMEFLAREGKADAAAAIMPSVARELRAIRAFLSTSSAVDG